MRKVKVGDLVCVITGNYKGTEGRVTKINWQKMRLAVEGIKKVTTNVKKGAYSTGQEGYTVDKERMIHWSNVMLIDPKTNKRTRTHILIEGKRKTRVTKSGFKIDWEKVSAKEKIDQEKKENKTDK